MARYPIKMLLDKDLGPFIPYLPSNSVVVEGTNKTVADQIIDLHNEINERITNVYRFKGSVTFENLPTTGQTTGDVYDITNDFTLDGKQYPAGTNVAWTTDHWDALTGMFSMASSYEILKLNTAIMSSVRSMYSTAFTVEANKNAWLRMINDAIKANKDIVHFITDADEGYTFKLHVAPAETGTVESTLLIYPPVDAIVTLQYGESYWISKKIRVTYTDGIATNVAIQASSGHSYHEMQYAKLKNTTAFTPTATTHLVTKGYVDNTVAKYTTMPTASASNLGSVAQYIGTTDTTYTKGHFYESVVDGSSNYSWQEVNFGGSGGGGDFPVYYMQATNSNTLFNFRSASPNANIHQDDQTKFFQIIKDAYDKGYYHFILVFKQLYTGTNILDVNLKFTGSSQYIRIYAILSSYNLDNYAYNHHASNGKVVNSFTFYVTQTNGVIETFTTPATPLESSNAFLSTNNTNVYIPVDPYNPATKDYVDSAISSASTSSINITNQIKFENGFSSNGLQPIKFIQNGKVFNLRGTLICPSSGTTNTTYLSFPKEYGPYVPTTINNIPVFAVAVLNDSNNEQVFPVRLISLLDSTTGEYKWYVNSLSNLSIDISKNIAFDLMWIKED